MKKQALILVDYQNEWMDKKSDYYVGEIMDVINRTNQLIEYCRKRDYKIIFTHHVEEDSKGEFQEGSKNAEIIPGLSRRKEDTLITKNKISPFYKTNLGKELRGIDNIVICGILTNLCVRSLIQDAYDRDYDITVVKDCCVALDNKTQEFTFRDLKATRDEIKFINLDEFIKN